MDFQNELKKLRMNAIHGENTTALCARASEVANFIETEILESLKSDPFTEDRTVRFSYIPDILDGADHKSFLYSPNVKSSKIEKDGGRTIIHQYQNNVYPKISFPTSRIFLTNVASILKMQKITVKEINRDRGYIIFEWSLDRQEYVTDSADDEGLAANPTPEEREKLEKEMDDRLWWMDRDGEL